MMLIDIKRNASILKYTIFGNIFNRLDNLEYLAASI